jgi:hypothetical protein
MRIELELFNAIIHSPLFPSHKFEFNGYEEVKHYLGKKPSSIDESKEWISKAIKGKLSPVYQPIPFALPREIFTSTSDTLFTPDKYPLHFAYTKLEGSRYKRFYGSIIDWECYRIFNTMIKYAISVNQDMRLRTTIKGTLRNLSSILGDIYHFYEYGDGPYIRCDSRDLHKEELDEIVGECNQILNFLFNRIVHLYYEIVIAFNGFCADYEPIDDILDSYRKRINNKEDIRNSFYKYLSVHKLQQCMLTGSHIDIKHKALQEAYSLGIHYEYPHLILWAENSLFCDITGLQTNCAIDTEDASNILSEAYTQKNETISAEDINKLSHITYKYHDIHSAPKLVLRKQTGCEIRIENKPKVKVTKLNTLTYKYLITNGDNLTNCFNCLKKRNLISEESSLTSFKQLFSGKSVTNRLIWTGNNRELVAFFRLLKENSLIEQNNSDALWEIVANSFTSQRNGNFTGEQLRKTSPTPKDKASVSQAIDHLKAI